MTSHLPGASTLPSQVVQGRPCRRRRGCCGHYNLRRANNKFMHFCYCPQDAAGRRAGRGEKQQPRGSWLSIVRELGRVLIQVNCRWVIVVVSNCVCVGAVALGASIPAPACARACGRLQRG